MPATSIPTITIGADPETFVREIATGKFVSAHTLMPGTKKEPHAVECGAVQVDGTLAEFNIVPAMTARHFVSYNLQVMAQMKRILGDKYEVVIQPTATYEPEYWKTLPADVKILGCDPDFNAYTGQVNPKPDPSANPSMRTASGHVHIGWGKNFDIHDPAHFADCCYVAKVMDFTLGIRSLLWDPDPTRRQLYGKAGCFRPKTYGMEYRTMSNQWLTNQDLMEYVYLQIYYAMKALFKGEDWIKQFPEDMAQKIIDENITDWYYRNEYKKLAKMIGPPPVIKVQPPKTLKPEDPDFYLTKVKESKKAKLLSSMFNSANNGIPSISDLVATLED